LDNIRQQVYLSKQLKEKLRYVSYRDKLSQSDIVNKALEEYLKDKITDNDLEQIMSLK